MAVSLELRGLHTGGILLCEVRWAVCSRTLVTGSVAAMGLQERHDRAGAVVQGVARDCAPVIARLDDLAEGHSLPRQRGADGPTENAMVVSATHLGHVPGVVPTEDLFAHG